jgi:hypothetical protein
MRAVVYTFLASLCLASACNDRMTLPSPDMGYQYFPLEVGQSWDYRVDSIVFDDRPNGNALDTFSSFLRYQVRDTFIDLLGEKAYEIVLSHRQSSDDPWQAHAIWTAKRTTDDVQLNEGNLRFVKMRFPLRPGVLWQPTTYIDASTEVPVGTELIEAYTNWQGAVLSIGSAEVIGDFDFDAVMTCMQADDDNQLERRFVREKYARGVGLVERMDTILDSRCKRLGQLEQCLVINNNVTPPDTTFEPWIQQGEKGYILHMVIIGFN